MDDADLLADLDAFIVGRDDVEGAAALLIRYRQRIAPGDRSLIADTASALLDHGAPDGAVMMLKAALEAGMGTVAR